MLSQHLFATFNPASSTFAVHAVPTLVPAQRPPAGGDGLGDHQNNMMPAGYVNDPTLHPAPMLPLQQAAQPGPFPETPLPNGASTGIKRFRLPSRGLHITLPSIVQASAFYPSNSYFPDPFLAYFILVHPDNLGELHLGVIPEIDPFAEDAVEGVGNVTDDTDSDADSEVALLGVAAGHQGDLANLEALVLAGLPVPPPAPAPPLVPLPPQENDGTQEQNPDDDPVEDPLPGLGPAPAQPPPAAPAGPEPTWLSTLRCVDSATRQTFAQNGKILHVGPIDHSIAIIRSTDEGRIEIFTTTALHSKPQITVPPRPGRAAAQPRADPFPGLVPAHNVPLPALPFMPGHGPIIPPLPRFAYPTVFHRHALPNLRSRASNLANSSAPGPSRVRPREEEDSPSPSATPNKRPRITYDQAGPSTTPAFAPEPAPRQRSFTPADHAYRPRTNPHVRLGPYAEGDYQCLAYQSPGEVVAATVDDVSGKIALIVESYERHEVVVLDYGWDFWKVDTNEETQWMPKEQAADEPEPEAGTSGTQTRSQSV